MLRLESLRYGGQDITSSANASIPTESGSLVVAECTADSTFTCTVEAQFNGSGDWIQVPCVHMDGGVLYRKAAGSTLTVTDGDVLFVAAPGSVVVRIKRAGGTATFKMAAVPDSLENLLAAAGLGAGSESNAPAKFAVIDNATSGDNTIVAAVTGKKIRVLAYLMVAAGAVNTRFESGAGGTALTGQMNWATNTGAMGNYSPVGHFETAAGALLNLELSGAVSVDGYMVYQEI